ncbi:MAG: NEW3 domain-containing protein [Candidatus Zixiibacteriota bacterium]
MQRFALSVALTAMLLAMFAPSTTAQNSNPFNQRDDKYRLLGLKRAKEAYEVARSEYHRQEEMFQRELITKAELERARSVFSDAEVNYQQSLLAVLFEEQYVSVEGAVKYQSQDGRKHVRLTLVNASGGSAEFYKLIEMEDELFRSLQPDVINNIYVSLLNDNSATISQPYEIKVEELRYGSPTVIDFALLQDLDVVTVYLIYGSGTQRNMKVFLQKDATVNKVAVQSEQFSQELELGKSTSFDLTLELFSGTENTFSLEVVNLPDQISRYFKEPSGSARLSQLKFTESTHTKKASLEITLPDRPTEQVAMDQPIAFFVLVIPRDRLKDLPDLRSKSWSQEEIGALGVGYARMEILPRGKGKLLVRAPQLYHSIKSDASVDMNIDLVNEGSHRLDNIEVKADMPLNWTKQIDPVIVSTLEIGAEHRINLKFSPPEDVSPGKYEVRLRTTAVSNSQPIVSEDKSVTVEILPDSNVLGTLLILILIIGLVAGIVVFGIKLSRR